MGCDIHIHAEVRRGDTWHHYGHYGPARSYRAFSKLAGVRAQAGDSDPILPIRGVPQDMSVVTAADWEEWWDDSHNATWATSDEVRVFEKWLQEIDGDWCALEKFLAGSWGDDSAAAFLFGNGWNKDALRDLRFQDFRWVIWFDN